MEKVFKGPAFKGPRLQVRHIHAVVEKVAQDVIQGPGAVLGRQDQSDFIGARHFFPVRSNDEKTSIVLPIVIDRFGQHVEAVHPGCRPIGNGPNVGIFHFPDLFGTL